MSVGRVDERIAPHHPLGCRIDIGTIGHIIEFSSFGSRNHSDVAIRIAAVADDFECKPFAVGRPLVVEARLVVGIVLAAVGDGSDLTALEVEHLQLVAVFDESDFLAVRGEGRMGAFHAVVLEERFFVDQGSVGKVQVVFTSHSRFVEIPHPCAFAGIHQGLAVWRQGQSLFSRCSMGDLFGCAEFLRTRKDFTAIDEGDFLAVVGGHKFVAARQSQLLFLVVVRILDDFDVHLLWSPLALHRIDFALVAEAQRAVGSLAEEAYRMLLEMGDGGSLFCLVKCRAIDIEAAPIAFAEKDDLSVGGKNRVAVLARISCNLSVEFGFGIIVIDVAGHGRDMMLAPYVFASGAVIVEVGCPVFVEAKAAYRCGSHLLRSAACYRDAIEFVQPWGRVEDALGRVLQCGTEIDFLVVW
ncbi:hypothetical protein EVA_01698 [gut metagenome]|uniref:Uncharacterized protein n=1 Tax=gut metagenome TaxID=749906 RepID=J9H2S4_9ZZZZ